MKKIKNDELANIANYDEFDLLDPNALDEVLGGAIGCKQGYALSDKGSVTCGCGYSASSVESQGSGPKKV